MYRDAKSAQLAGAPEEALQLLHAALAKYPEDRRVLALAASLEGKLGR